MKQSHVASREIEDVDVGFDGQTSPDVTRVAMFNSPSGQCRDLDTQSLMFGIKPVDEWWRHDCHLRFALIHGFAPGFEDSEVHTAMWSAVRETVDLRGVVVVVNN